MRLTEKILMVLSSEITAVSQQQANHLQQRYRRNVLHIPNGVETHPRVNRDRAQLTLKGLGCPTHGYILFAANRIMPIKGAHLFLEAYRKLPQGCPPAVVVGDLSIVSAYGAKLRTLASERVHFVPPIQDKQELFGIIRNSGLFVFPSIEEGMSMMLLEVASLGVPLVCSDILPNIAVLNERGFYFRSEDVDDLTEKLRWALGHPEKMEEIARRIQDHVRHHFSWDQVAEEYEKIYRRVIGLDLYSPQQRIEAP
jgi:glycosyltransferase involved in cell wall biosynthesis